MVSNKHIPQEKTLTIFLIFHLESTLMVQLSHDRDPGFVIVPDKSGQCVCQPTPAVKKRTLCPGYGADPTVFNSASMSKTKSLTDSLVERTQGNHLPDAFSRKCGGTASAYLVKGLPGSPCQALKISSLLPASGFPRSGKTSLLYHSIEGWIGTSPFAVTVQIICFAGRNQLKILPVAAILQVSCCWLA